jgi:hypothetical protein
MSAYSNSFEHIACSCIRYIYIYIYIIRALLFSILQNYNLYIYYTKFSIYILYIIISQISWGHS